MPDIIQQVWEVDILDNSFEVNVVESITEVEISTAAQGPGVAPGGTTAQHLAKVSDDDFDTEWVDAPTGAVDSVFDRTGEVVAEVGDYTTAQVTELTNLYYTEARVAANTDVAANTAVRHSHANKTELDLITDGDHDVRIDNPHGVTKAQVGLGNVTNDSQLKRAASDFATFTNVPASNFGTVLYERPSDEVKQSCFFGDLPINNATALALVGKAPLSHQHLADDITDWATYNLTALTLGATNNIGVGTYVDFTPQATPPARVEGRVWYDSVLRALTLFPAGTEVTQTLGHELLGTVYNSNGTDILNGQVVALDPAGPTEGSVYLANASDAATAKGTFGVATELIETATVGLATAQGVVHDIDTSAWPVNTLLYLDTVDGGMTDTIPESPAYNVVIGIVLVQHATAGSIYVRPVERGNEQDLDNFFNGASIESTSNVISSDGSIVSIELSTDGGGDLSLIFDDELFVLDTPTSVNLTIGTDTAPVMNYVFIPKTTKLLTANTTGFPTAQHVPVATVYVQSAASVQADGPAKYHQWSDHMANGDGQGHASHVNKWIRSQHATWLTGGVPNITIESAPAPDNVYFDMTAGTALQLHVNSFAAVDMGTGDPVFVVNHPSGDFTRTTDLNTLLVDSNGGSLSGRYFSLVFLAIVNSDATTHVLCNLPSDSYGNAADAISDPENFANYTLPPEFRGVGILIARAVLRHQIPGSGTWTLETLEDLRGNLIGTSAGGTGVGGSTEFSDTGFRVFNATDATKVLALDAATIATGTTRTLTAPDADGTIALVADIVTAHSGLSGVGTNTHAQIDAHLALVNEHIDWTNATQDLLTTGSINAQLNTQTSRSLFFADANIPLSGVVSGVINGFDIDYDVTVAAGAINVGTTRGIRFRYNVVDSGAVVPNGIIQIIDGRIDAGGMLFDAGNTKQPMYYEMTNPAPTQDFSQGFMRVHLVSGTSGTAITFYSDATINGATNGIAYRGHVLSTSGATGSMIGVQGFVSPSSGATHSETVAIDGAYVGVSGVAADKRMGLRGQYHTLTRNGSIIAVSGTPATPNAVATTHLDFVNNTGEIYAEGNAEIDGELFCDGNESKSLIETTTTPYAAADKTYIIMDATAGNKIVNLPLLSSLSGNRVYVVKKADISVNSVTLTPAGSDLIEGAATLALTTPGQVIKIIKGNSGSWYVVL